jgi:hypothetical protein
MTASKTELWQRFQKLDAEVVEFNPQFLSRTLAQLGSHDREVCVCVANSVSLLFDGMNKSLSVSALNT